MCAGEKIKEVSRSLYLRFDVREFEGSRNVVCRFVLSVLSGEAQKPLCAVAVTTHRPHCTRVGLFLAQSFPQARSYSCTTVVYTHRNKAISFPDLFRVTVHEKGTYFPSSLDGFENVEYSSVIK